MQCGVGSSSGNLRNNDYTVLACAGTAFFYRLQRSIGFWDGKAAEWTVKIPEECFNTLFSSLHRQLFITQDIQWQDVGGKRFNDGFDGIFVTFYQ
jgi:hypothetical protein